MEVMHRCQDLRAIVSVEFIDFWRGAAAKGLPPWAAISAGPKVRRLRCRRSPATIESVDRFVNPLPAAPSVFSEQVLVNSE